jgi:hypothetical protein
MHKNSAFVNVHIDMATADICLLWVNTYCDELGTQPATSLSEITDGVR